MIFLLDAVIKSSVILIGALGAASALRSSSAAIRHLVLAAGIACAALAPLLTVAMPAWGSAIAPALSGTVIPMPVSDGVATSMASGPVLSAVAAEESTHPATVTLLTQRNSLLVWASGALSGLLLLAVGFGRLTGIARKAGAPAEPWRKTLAEVCARHGLSRLPRLLQSDHPSLLVTWGARRPTILLPVAARDWSAERIRVVLDHELAHVARHDWLVQIGAELLRCVYWFNPLVWIACRRLRQESEQACDDRVLSMGHAGTTYASHLLDLARALRPPDRLWVPAAAIARPSSLERRVAAMLTTNVNRNPVGPWSAIVIALLLLGVTLPVASYEAVAQSRFATVSGVATDQVGGVLTNATVVLTNVETSAKYEVRTNRTGYYEVTPLPAGRYELELRSPGFLASKDSVSLGVGESLQRNVSLNVSNLQETITVMNANDDAARVSEVARPTSRKPCPDPSVGGCINPPVKVKDVRPLYPTALRDRGITGVVTLDAVIDVDGRVKDMRVMSSSHPELEQHAMNAVRQWEFSSTLLNGQPIEVTFNTIVAFGVDAPRRPQQPSPR